MSTFNPPSKTQKGKRAIESCYQEYLLDTLSLTFKVDIEAYIQYLNDKNKEKNEPDTDGTKTKTENLIYASAFCALIIHKIFLGQGQIPTYKFEEFKTIDVNYAKSALELFDKYFDTQFSSVNSITRLMNDKYFFKGNREVIKKLYESDKFSKFRSIVSTL